MCFFFSSSRYDLISFFLFEANGEVAKPIERVLGNNAFFFSLLVRSYPSYCREEKDVHSGTHTDNIFANFGTKRCDTAEGTIDLGLTVAVILRQNRRIARAKFLAGHISGAPDVTAHYAMRIQLPLLTKREFPNEVHARTGSPH